MSSKLNLSNVCAICLADAKFLYYPISKYLDEVFFSTNIQINLVNDLITKICSDCIKNLQGAKDFKELCCKTQKTLSEYVKEESSHDTDFCFYDNKEIELSSMKNEETPSIEPEDIPDNTSDFESYFEPPTPIPPVRKVLQRKKIKIKKPMMKKPLSKLNEVKMKLKQKQPPKSKNVTTQCDLCGQIFNNRYKYKHHYEVVHEGVRQKCHICQKDFMSIQTLTRHMAVHLNEKKFKCKFENCDRAYNDISSRLVHYKTHSDEKTYVCKICNNAFKHSSTLRAHLLTHTNVKKLVCEVCGQGFNEPYKMRDHVLIHTGEKPIDCPDCDEMFRSKKQLRVHIRKIH